MYGSDSDEDDGGTQEKYVELKQEVVELRTLHKREEELYFYDAFAYPWEKDKHYKMVYKLEKKYFPDHCLDKAFLEPGETNAIADNEKAKKRVGKRREKEEEIGDGGDGKGLVFFEGEKDEKELVSAKEKELSEKKVEEFFKCLKKVPNKDVEGDRGEPYIVTRKGELPPRWDGPSGTVVLINKPKGELLSSLYFSLNWLCFVIVWKLKYIKLIYFCLRFFINSLAIGLRIALEFVKLLIWIGPQDQTTSTFI